MISRVAPSSRLMLLAVLIISIFAITSCARKITFIPNSAVPTAEGRVKVKKDKNDNFAISLTLKNLIPSNQLQPPRGTYMVWMETLYNGTQNLGQLKTSSGLFSKTLKASLETTSPYKPVRVFITAEDNLNVQYPGAQMVLSTNPF